MQIVVLLQEGHEGRDEFAATEHDADFIRPLPSEQALQPWGVPTP